MNLSGAADPRCSAPAPRWMTMNASTPPSAATMALSTHSSRTSRQREAPSARRMANSCWRSAPRASIRFARFVQATTRTRPTRPSRSGTIVESSASSVGRSLLEPTIVAVSQSARRSTCRVVRTGNAASRRPPMRRQAPSRPPRSRGQAPACRRRTVGGARGHPRSRLSARTDARRPRAASRSSSGSRSCRPSNERGVTPITSKGWLPILTDLPKDGWIGLELLAPQPVAENHHGRIILRSESFGRRLHSVPVLRSSSC